jgi:hypothetical protein
MSDFKTKFYSAINEAVVSPEEGLHLIKEIDPERAERLYQSAVTDPSTLGWLKESYKRYGKQFKIELEKLKADLSL